MLKGQLFRLVDASGLFTHREGDIFRFEAVARVSTRYMYSLRMGEVYELYADRFVAVNSNQGDD